eukprot:CAMPEP_0114544282 /NCGR_PEP_ID=MMETSP0114-20121206/2792_1 /TAXON_ID=31324 /ORGANISM="Goniomonas sp, Strain m" /LENGTH=335 /DNA_ID=CAMNT_0001728649 /DNA_START=11 /DNA_END=1018 /DNA_ORIENTATION=+
MRFVVIAALLVLSCTASPNLPTQEDYDEVHTLEAIPILPWPHSIQPPFRRLTPQQILDLANKYFDNVPYPQNASAMVECLFDWSTPDYRRMQFPLTTPHNLTGMKSQIDYWPLQSFPYCPTMFNLSAVTVAQDDIELTNNFQQILRFCAAETAIIQYALYSLKPAEYGGPGVPDLLYRGGGRNVDFYCNQFGDEYGLSVDDCVARHFYAGNSVKVKTFWSTTPDATVIAHYTGAAQYTIMPSPTRSSWIPREIDMFSTQPTSLEWLYPHGSSFTVINATCDTTTGSPFWKIFLQEGHSPSETTEDVHMPTVTQCVSPVHLANAKPIPEELARFFD